MLGISANLSISPSYAGSVTGRAASRRDRPAAGSADGAADRTAEASAAGAAGGGGKALSPDQQKQVESLKSRDAEVRRHEAAHLAAAGGFARGGPVFNYKAGPDGRQYAVGGHVDVDTSVVAGDPKATLAKARQVQRAALAPADPSGQDHAVAASAAATAAKAQSDLSAERTATTAGASGSAGASSSAGAAADATSGKRSKSSRAGGAAATAYAKAAPQAAPAGGGIDVIA
jgi:hypothetical protein